MGEVIDLPETFRVHMAVDLRGRERRVPEQLLNRPQIGAAFEQMRRERVAEAVRVGKEPAERARVEAPAAHGEEERVLGAARELRPRVPEIARDDGATPPRRAAPRAPCRPSRGRGRAPARSRRHRGRGRPLPRSAARRSRRARPGPGCAGRAARRHRSSPGSTRSLPASAPPAVAAAAAARARHRGRGSGRG